METDEFSERWAPYAIAALRIVTALLFLEHGTSKILGIPPTSMSNPSTWSIYWIAGWIELIGGLLMLTGTWTRFVGIILAGEMAIGYWLIHGPISFFPIVNKGESAILYCFIFLMLAVVGPGEFSVDKILYRRRDPIQGYEAPGGERSYYLEDDNAA